jgi:uncharacterized protein DUF3568
MDRRLGGIALMLAVALASQGCAGMAGQSVNYTLDGVAYRTFSAPLDQMQRATLTTFRRMDLALQRDEMNDDGCRELVAAAGDRTIHVELEKLGARTTRMRITAKQGWLLRDRAAAGELLVQTERALSDSPAVSQRRER